MNAEQQIELLTRDYADPEGSTSVEEFEEAVERVLRGEQVILTRPEPDELTRIRK